MRLALIAFATLTTGCLISSSHTGTGDDVGPPPGGAGPVGKTFVAMRSQIGSSPCPNFDFENAQRQLQIQAAAVLVDGSPSTGVIVRNVAANMSNGDAPNITFSTMETWSSVEGPAFPRISWMLWADGPIADGQASTSFPFDGTQATACAYTWDITAF